MDVFGHNRPMVPDNFPRQLPPGSVIGPNTTMRPFGSQGGLEPLISSFMFCLDAKFLEFNSIHFKKYNFILIFRINFIKYDFNLF